MEDQVNEIKETNTISTISVSLNDQSIATFLKYADLEKFEALFQRSGITKFEHLNDVQVEDLSHFGFTDFEVRRFTRKKQEFMQQSSLHSFNHSSADDNEEPKGRVHKNMGPLQQYRPTPPWQLKSMGFVPNATSKRAIYMNSLLPDFYKAKFKHCKNAKQFVKEFHGTGRQLYQLTQQVESAKKNIDSLLNKNNPAAAGCVLESDYRLVPSDKIRIANNIQKANEIKAKLSSIDHDIKTLDSKLFSSASRKLIHGEEATHKEFELLMGKITAFQARLQNIYDSLVNLQSKCSRLFTVSNRPSKKRKQKQNKRKYKRAKEARREANSQKVLEIIAPQHPCDSTNPIEPSMLHLEGISGLFKRQKSYIQYTFEKGLFTQESKDVIKQYLRFNLESDDDGVDDGVDDDVDDYDHESDSTSDDDINEDIDNK